jgi:hypothetical protein
MLHLVTEKHGPLIHTAHMLRCISRSACGGQHKLQT